jgi:drug/metabolite transporter (DMT)-like permease
MLFLLAAIWGASYLFIKVAVEDIEPGPMMASRALGAAVLLAGYLAVTMGGRRAVTEVASNWRPAIVLGALNAAIPFWLVAWGEKHIDSSVAGIAQSTVPIFTFLLATRFLPHEHVGMVRIAGVALGFLGVAVLAGLHPSGGWWGIAGTLAVVLSSLAGPVLATGSMLAGGLLLVPLAIAQFPSSAPDLESIASLLALTILGTAFAQLILFRILRLYGSRKLSLVTYLMPGFAVVYGAVFLDEVISGAALAGLALILGGVALASGARLLRPRAQQEPA